jgi:predicted membrane protein
MKTAVYAILGVMLILFAIPLGLMLTPLIIGAILLWLGLRRADRSLQPIASGAAA